ncbi:MAG: S8 family serine peptidase, partial [Bacteroidia bacterium]|nr:S8 family serine peptidase [Bacteroidia bacterium]
IFIQYTFAQNSSTYFIVYLKDKANSNYSIEQPEKFLSTKAIERRKKQYISITSNDIPVNKQYIQAIQLQGVKIVNTSKWFNLITITNVNSNQLNAIKTFSFVKEVQEIKVQPSTTIHPKFELEKETTEIITSSINEKQTTSFDYGLSYIQANQIGADCMHNLGYTGSGVTIAVIDAGFMNTHILPTFDSIRTNNQILGCRDFVTGDTLVYEDYPHGMNVLSCMAGNTPGYLVGTAPKANYWLLRTEDIGSETPLEEIYWAIAAEFADSVGADIINSSLGYSTFDNPADNHSFADMDGNTTIITKAADIAASKGIFVTTSAGNAGGPPWYKITAPADADSALTVGAVDSLGVITGFSSRGLTFDGRIKPNVVARGHQTRFATSFGGFTQGNGTSFSSPVTAGAVACLWQANPTASNMDLLYAIQQSANQNTAPDSIKGYGIPNFCLANTLLTSIAQIDNEIGFNIYPNPVSNELTIQFLNKLKTEQAIITIYDALGQVVTSA